MTEIDWSKAPEGAIGAFIKDKGGKTFFVSSKNDSDYQGRPGFEGEQCEGGEYHVFAEYWTWFERPAVWTGEGLPPVGTVCEYLFSEGDEWRSCAVVAHYEGRAVVCDLLDDASERVPERNLRPIRTPEQIAAEEREKAIREITDIGIRATTRWAEAIYDAGYRKVEGGTP